MKAMEMKTELNQRQKYTQRWRHRPRTYFVKINVAPQRAGKMGGPREMGVHRVVSFIMRGPESNVDVDEPWPGTRREIGQNRDP